VPRKRRITDTWGQVHAIEGTVYGVKLIVLTAARTQIPLVARGVAVHEPEVRSRRALVTQTRTALTGDGRLRQVVFAQWRWDGGDRWWLAQHALRIVVPAPDNMAVTVAAQTQAAAGEGVTIGRRVHTRCYGQDRTAGTEWLATEVVDITGRTTNDQEGSLG
jgi:hypothetical protein